MDDIELKFPHNVGISSVFEQHVFHLLNWLDLLPLTIFYQLFVNLVVSFEEIIESLITVSNVPSYDSSLLDYPDELSEGLGHNGAGEHAGATEQDVVGVVGDLELSEQVYQNNRIESLQSMTRSSSQAQIRELGS